MFLQRIHFDFYGALVLVESNWSEVILLLQKDFSCFLLKEIPTNKSPFFSLTIFKQQKSLKEASVPEIKASMQTQNSLSYDHNGIRYNDYYGELLSEMNFKKEEAILYSLNLDKMHEIAYLIILSRVGKKLDLMGLHKLHAFAVSYDDLALVCMMPTRGGKSTLLMELLKNPKIKIISDDIPLINRAGQVLGFPMKIGLDSLPAELSVSDPDNNIYEMKRSQYGTKKLISLQGLSHKVESLDKKFSSIILVEAFRHNSEKSLLVKSSLLKTSKGLFKHGVIGFGLPMILEYFWEFGISDFLKKTFIFFSRALSFLRLSLRSKKYILFLGREPKLAAEEIIRSLIETAERTKK